MSFRGISARLYICFQLRMRSPSGLASASSRGRVPVATNVMSALSRSSTPSDVMAMTCSVPSRRPLPRMVRMPSSFRRAWISALCWAASFRRRSFLATASTRTPSSRLVRDASAGTRPSFVALRMRVMTSATAIRPFEGTPSVSTAEPPTPASSTIVTFPPRWAATSAAS